jgi:hypothetical protein
MEDKICIFFDGSQWNELYISGNYTAEDHLRVSERLMKSHPKLYKKCKVLLCTRQFAETVGYHSIKQIHADYARDHPDYLIPDYART